MFPVLPVNDKTDHGFGYPELLPDLGVAQQAGGVQRPDRDDITSGEFGVPFSLEHATFGDGVMHVIGIGAEPQVPRVDAGRIVAMMAAVGGGMSNEAIAP